MFQMYKTKKLVKFWNHKQREFTRNFEGFEFLLKFKFCQAWVAHERENHPIHSLISHRSMWPLLSWPNATKQKCIETSLTEVARFWQQRKFSSLGCFPKLWCVQGFKKPLKVMHCLHGFTGKLWMFLELVWPFYFLTSLRTVVS